MSKRVHHVLGYGLRPFVPDARFHDAKRGKPPIMVWAQTHVEEVLATGADAVSLAALIQSPQLAGSSLRGWDPLWSLVYDDESISDLLVVVPPSQVGRWTRYDDDIDYVAACVHKRRAPVAIDLSTALDSSHPLRLYPRGEPPVEVRLLMAYIGLAHRVSELRETLYIFWA